MKFTHPLLIVFFAVTSAQAAGPTDPQIAGIVVTANQVDIDAGNYALTHAQSREVKDFAQLMVTDHGGVNKSATELVQRLHVTPQDSPTSEKLKEGGQANLAALQKASGATFDRNYTGRVGQQMSEDGSVARRIADGDRAAFEVLMRRHNRKLYRLARATLRDDVEAEDALQEAYLSAFRSMGQFRGDACLSTWLSRLVLNECLGRIRRHDRRQNVIPMVRADDQVTATCVDESESPDAATTRAQVRNLLERRVDELPNPFRTVFVMRSVEDLSVAETALILGIPEETVRSRHFRAKSLLRAALEAQLGQAESDLFDFGGRHCDRIVAAVLARLSSQAALFGASVS